MTLPQWPFDQAPNVAAVTSKHITMQGFPILLVTHYDDDDSWGFQSGLPVIMADAQVVLLKEIVAIDPSVVEVADLLPGWSAERESVGGEWKRALSVWPDGEQGDSAQQMAG